MGKVRTPDPDLVARFRSETEALIERPLGTDKLLVAVSGGPDSLALLLLAHAAFGDRVLAATVDHQLRPENADEAGFVASLCAGLAIRHETLKGAAIVHPGSMQDQARRLRYKLLGDQAACLGCRWLATGHHLDDQAETLLMRMSRGSGLPGLAAIRPRRPVAPAIDVIRPLLGWTRDALRSVVDEAGLTPVDDPSNRSPDHDRTRFRTLLADAPLLKPERLAASASHLGDCDDALSWATAREWDARVGVEHGGTWRIDATGLPREYQRRFAMRAIDEVRAEQGVVADWRRDGVARLLDLLDAGRTATLAHVRCSGGLVWRFEAAPPRRASRAQA